MGEQARAACLELDETEKNVVRALQDDFPLVKEPYKELAGRVGLSEEEFLGRVRRFDELGCIRKMGAVLQHRTAGFTANVLCAWEVPPEKLAEVAEIMSAHSAVSHCYDRNPAPNWNYNLYTMIHAKSRAECDAVINELSKLTGITDFQALYSVKEWKKTSMKYFRE